jgi:hypothetical protein
MVPTSSAASAAPSLNTNAHFRLDHVTRYGQINRTQAEQVPPVDAELVASVKQPPSRVGPDHDLETGSLVNPLF